MRFSRLGALALLIAAILLCSVCPAEAHNYSLTIKKDTRRVIDLGVFGFGGNSDGVFQIKLNYLTLDEEDEYQSVDEKIGFTLDMVSTAMYARQERNYAVKETKKDRGEDTENVCFVNDPAVSSKNRYLIPLEEKLATMDKDYDAGSKISRSAAIKKRFAKSSGLSTTIKIPVAQAGLYGLFFYNCKKANKNKDPVHTSFSVEVSQFNTDEYGARSFLSVGDTHLPAMYFVFFLLFGVGMVLWHRVIFNSSPEIRANVRAIHYLMYFLIVIKCITLLLHSVLLHYRKQSGRMNGGWDYIFYIFQTLKGITLFAVIVLLGTGWSFLKPFLSERDRNLLFLLLPLQIIINIAIAVIEESSEGNQNWGRWRDILRIFDIVCCCAVLLPVIWSMKLMKDSATTDGKARQNLRRLRQFRTFYIAVVAFIYFTRIVVTFVDNSASYRHTWLSHFLYEAAALLFYCFTGLRFQPKRHTDRIGDEDDESDEEIAAAMRSDDVEELDLDERDEVVPEVGEGRPHQRAVTIAEPPVTEVSNK